MLRNVLLLMGVHGCGKTSLARKLTTWWPNVVYRERSAAKETYLTWKERGLDTDAINPFVASERGMCPDEYCKLLFQFQSDVISRWIENFSLCSDYANNSTSSSVVVMDRGFDPLAYTIWHYAIYRAVYDDNTQWTCDVRKSVLGDKPEEAATMLSDWCQGYAKYVITDYFARICSTLNGTATLATGTSLDVCDFVRMQLCRYADAIGTKTSVLVYVMAINKETLKHHDDLSLPLYFYCHELAECLDSAMRFVARYANRYIGKRFASFDVVYDKKVVNNYLDKLQKSSLDVALCKCCGRVDYKDNLEGCLCRACRIDLAANTSSGDS